MNITDMPLERVRILYEVDKAKHDLEVELGIREPRRELSKKEFMGCVRRARQMGPKFLQTPYLGACGCVGPQDGEPACPCNMASMTEENKYAILLYLLGNPLAIDDEKPDFEVHILPVDIIGKVQVVKLIRQFTGDGLYEAKQKADRGGLIFTTKDFFKATTLVAELEKLGVSARTE